MAVAVHSVNERAIAVIGMAGRFPGARDIDAFWDNLVAGREGITRFGEAELRAAAVDPELLHDASYVPANGLLDDIEMFDAPFFGLSPLEAETTDPQHRVFLECAWHALEDAGYAPERFLGRIGVFAGAGLSTYLLHNLLTRPDVMERVSPVQLSIGNNKDYAPTRVSYKLNLTGPSISINTACSSSLVAVHLACQSLLDYHSDMVLAGGVAIQVPQHVGYRYHSGGIVSPDGHCRPFDARAEGTVSGNGVGIVVLRRLGDAIADGDAIRAVILGSAVNNDGAAKVGYTAPSVHGQAEVIAEALAVAEVAPDTVQYVEAHGTATVVGDPIEIAALTKAFRLHTSRARFCAIGSVKSNIGHLDEAAGAAGLIKTILALQHRTLPASLHFETPNPTIDFSATPFYVNATTRDWASDGLRRAGVSSFGIGGTNAHVVLEEAPPPEAAAQLDPSEGSTAWELLPVSGRTDEAVRAACERLATHLTKDANVPLADVAWTLQQGRRAFPKRQVVLAADRRDAVNKLRAAAASGTTVQPAADQRKVAFLFPGQGAQYARMGRSLYDAEPVFRQEIDRCADTVRSCLGADLRDLLSGSDSTALQSTLDVQPALFAVEYALARLWMSWGIEPHAMLGHSLGEYVAATIAGLFTVDDALRLVVTRAALMNALPRGAMLAVPLGESDVAAMVSGELSIAAVNAPARTVVAGTQEAIDDFGRRLAKRGLEGRRLATSHAFHSAAMERIVATFAAEVAGVQRHQPTRAWMSNVTGESITLEQAQDPAYWSTHLRQTVRFAPAADALLADPHLVFVEVGPGGTLASLLRQQQRFSAERMVVQSLPGRDAAIADALVVRESLGRVWTAGVEVDWRAVHHHQPRRRVALPTYPFARERYWIDPGGERIARPTAEAGKRRDVRDWFYLPSWKRTVPPLAAASPRAHVILIDSRQAFAATLADHLRTAGHAVETLRVDHVAPAAYAAVLDAVRRCKAPVCVVDCSTLGIDPRVPHDHQRRYTEHALRLAQTLVAAERTLAAVTITDAVADVTGTEVLDAEKAAMTAVWLVLSQEKPAIESRVIDITGWSDQSPSQLLLDDLVGGRERFVAWRGRRRWVRSFDAAHEPFGDRAAPLREGGTYLITGGLGGVGLILAEHLARRYHARLALVGRSALALDALGDDNTVGGATSVSAARTQAMDHAIAAAAAELKIRPVSAYPGLDAAAADFVCSHIVALLEQAGVGTAPGSVCDVEDVKRRLRVTTGLERLCAHCVHVLERQGVVARRDDVPTFTERVSALLPPAEQLRRIREAYPHFTGTFDLLQHCFEHYPAALAGEIPAISVLYPGGEATLLERAAAHTTAHSTREIYTRAVRDLLVDFCRQNPHRRLRVLEVGIGDGILAGVVAPALREFDVEYHATDISRAFVVRAERAAAEAGLADMIHPGVLDIASEPSAQGYGRRSFDVVLALDVLHATPDVATTLQHVESLLHPGGVALILEAVSPPLWTDFIWGLADGWWGFRDTRRHRSPLLPLQDWVGLCREQGFAEVAAWPSGVAVSAESDYGLVMAHAGGDLARHAAQVVRRLRDAGTDVLLLAADVADEEALAAAVSAAEERFGPLDGVIHAAGITARERVINPIEATSLADLRAVLHPKVDGTLALSRVLASRTLDFVLLMSSNASVLGGLGLSAYAAASRYLDAFAAARHAEGDTRWVSANWDGWPTSPAAGMAPAFETSIDRYAMSLDECRTAFERVLAARMPQVVVSAGDLAARVERWVDRGSSTEPATAVRAASESRSHERPELSTGFEPPTTVTERTLATLWEELLGVHRVGANDAFAALGGDSLLGTQLIARVERTFGCRMPFRSLFEEPTVRLQAARIDTLMAQSTASPDSIPRVAPQEHYPLSHAQRRLWVLSQLEGSAAYNIPLHQVLDGALDIDALRRAFDRLVARHETLRTRVVLVDGEPYQQIDAPRTMAMEVVDLTRNPHAEQAARMAAQASAAEAFDLSRTPFRVSVLRLESARHILLFTIHHIACDGVSIDVLARDLARYYRAERTGNAAQLPELRLQYRDYAAWQAARLASGALDTARAYWLRQLGAPAEQARPPVPTLELPTDYPRPSVQTFQGRERRWQLAPAIAERLGAVARAHGVSLFMLLNACIKVLLYRYTGQQDVVVGTPVAGRLHPNLEDQVGFYLNLLALRDRVTPGMRFAELLQQVGETATAAYEHQEYPFDRLVDELALRRDLSRSPLFDVIVMLQNQQQSALALDGLESRPFFEHNGTSKVDLTFNFKQSPHGLAIGIEYNTDLFTDARIARMGEHLRRLFEQVVADPAVRVGAIDFLSPAETDVIRTANHTARPDDARTVLDLVYQQAGATPARVACECAGACLTYGELHNRSAALARALETHGVLPGDLVGVYLDRSIEIVPVLLGILSAGAAYVPLDPAFPPDRLRYIAADAAVRFVITADHLVDDCRSKFGAIAAANGILTTSVVWDQDISIPVSARPPGCANSAIAYVMYTSGSTGRPKGVAVTHGALANFLAAMRETPGLRPDDVLVAVTTWSFDISGLELFLPLVVGARLVIATRADTTDGMRLQRLLHASAATVLQATPATWQLMFESGWNGQPTLTALCGGEAMPASLGARLVRGCREVWNLYGPTETTIWSSTLNVTRWFDAVEAGEGGSVPIGYPIANTTLQVVDAALEPAPIGVPGELYIGGAGLARGYTNLRDVTADRFVPDPWSDCPGARMYRTGDVAVRRSDGAVQFLGRSDDQVKLRGFRIELAEIEDALLKHPSIAQAAVVTEGIGADTRLIAFAVPQPGMDIADGPRAVDALRVHLREWLPEYMLPASFVALDQLPRTPNGKIDRQALAAALTRTVPVAAAAPPPSDLERQLCRLWAEVLQHEQVGVQANFFDLGGHSLAAARLAFQISKETGIAVELTDVFQHPTVADLAAVVSRRRDDGSGASDAARHQAIPIAPMTAEERDMLLE